MRRILLCLLLCPVFAAVARDFTPPAEFNCEPSRACAVDLARAAGRSSHQEGNDKHNYVMALLTIGDLQLADGDKAGLAATMAEILKVVPPGDEIGYRANLAGLQVRAGQLKEANATVRSMRDAKRRNDAWIAVSRVLASEGKWREALEFAKQKRRDKTDWPAESDVMRDLADTGRVDWVREAVAVLEPKEEAYWLAVAELKTENFAAARQQALRITDVGRRLTMIEQIGSEADAKQRWDELATTARLIPPEAAKLALDDMPRMHYEIAVEWLLKAGALEDAQALLPKLGTETQKRGLAVIASERARRGDYKASIGMLGSISPDFRNQVNAAIAIGKVMAGDEKLDSAMTSIADRDRRMDALEYLGEHLPDARREEARAALRQWVELAQGPYVEDRAIRLGMLASLQAKRGFFDDALATALLVHDTEELLGAYGDIGVAQASKGMVEDARKTFVIAEAQARKYRFNSEDHAWLTEAIANAGLLPETFAQVQAMCRRAPDAYWQDQQLDSAIQQHIKAGQLQRAFEIAGMLSVHDSNNPHYFLVIAEALANKPDTGRP